MTIVLATGIYPPDIGGPATYGAFLVEHLRRRGHTVKIVTYGSSGISRKIPKGIRHLLFFTACLLRGIGADIIFAQDTVSAGYPASLAAKVLGKKFVLRVPGDYAWEQGVGRFGVKDSIDEFQTRTYGVAVERLRAIQKRVANRAHAIIAPSLYFQKIVQGWVNNPEKVACIYNGIELQPTPNNQRLATREEKIIFSSGRLVPWKGFDVLVKIMEEVPEHKLIIAGDGPERENLELLRQKSLAKERISLRGNLSRTQIDELLRESSVFMLNTSFESFSFQIVEAMNAGIPVIATSVCNIPEIIDNEKEGILVKPNDSKALIVALRRCEGKEFREKIVSAAKEKAKQFSFDNTITKLEKLFSTL